jgi:hypothetical protein
VRIVALAHVDDGLEPAAGSGAADRTLAVRLAQAKRRAREHATAARLATGSLPLAVRLHVDLARVLAAGDLDDRRAALREYRAASRFAQLAVTLARRARP